MVLQKWKHNIGHVIPRCEILRRRVEHLFCIDLLTTIWGSHSIVSADRPFPLHPLFADPASSAAEVWRLPIDGNRRSQSICSRANSNPAADESRPVDQYRIGDEARGKIHECMALSSVKEDDRLTLLSARSNTSRKFNRSGKPARLSNWLHDRFRCCKYWNESKFSITRIWFDRCR